MDVGEVAIDSRMKGPSMTEMTSWKFSSHLGTITASFFYVVYFRTTSPARCATWAGNNCSTTINEQLGERMANYWRCVTDRR